MINETISSKRLLTNILFWRRLNVCAFKYPLLKHFEKKYQNVISVHQHFISVLNYLYQIKKNSRRCILVTDSIM